MSAARKPRMKDYLAESRTLYCLERVPLIKILLSMAEAIVAAGSVRNPLEYYNELANQCPPPTSSPDRDPGPVAKIYRVCSTSVGKLTAALSVCPEGVRSKDHQETVHLLVLLSAPANAESLCSTVAAQVGRLLQPAANRRTLVDATGPATAWAALVRMESELTSTSAALRP